MMGVSEPNKHMDPPMSVTNSKLQLHWLMTGKSVNSLPSQWQIQMEDQGDASPPAYSNFFGPWEILPVTSLLNLQVLFENIVLQTVTTRSDISTQNAQKSTWWLGSAWAHRGRLPPVGPRPSSCFAAGKVESGDKGTNGKGEGIIPPTTNSWTHHSAQQTYKNNTLLNITLTDKR